MDVALHGAVGTPDQARFARDRVPDSSLRCGACARGAGGGETPPQSSASVAAVIATVTAGAGGSGFAAGGWETVGARGGGSTVSCVGPALLQARRPPSTHAKLVRIGPA